MSTRKRRHVSRKRSLPDPDKKHIVDPALFIQAHEADIIRGPRGHAAALSLEIRQVEGETDIGSGLIRLGDDDYVPADFPEDDFPSHKDEGLSHSRAEAIWVDRYDARLLLDPQILSGLVNPENFASTPDSPTGWSDLPSDAEETFSFTPEETEDFRREKRRRLMDQNREERLKARMEEDGEEVWGGSDEEPEESQKEIMRRTARSLLVSPNPAQLEMRILANHGADVRFAFLRGRWSRAWKIVKARARADKAEEEVKKAVPKAALVADYGDSSDEGDDSKIEIEEKEEAASTATEDTAEMKAAKELRRARAREWMESRKSASNN